MIQEILKTWQENTDGMTSESSPRFKCKYCEKAFRKESTLAAHLCELKRRYQQEKEQGVQMGFQAYLRFFELTQGSASLKTYTNLVESPYYNAFVKYGRHCQAIRCVNFKSYTDWLLKNNKKLDHWCKEDHYVEWLSQYLHNESVQDALERSIREIQRYADETDSLQDVDYFRYGNANKICYHISNGRVSAWVVFNCDSGIEFLERLNEDQLNVVLPWIDPEFWQRKFQDYLADREWVREILKQGGF
jgi:hypothetical protein